MAKKKRKKYPNLPAGFGTIRYLGEGRRNCYAVHPPSTVNERGKAVRPKALCYVDDYVKGFAVLTAYKAGTYRPGMERELEIAPTTDADALISRIIADYNTIKGVEDKHPEIKRYTFKEVYEKFLEWKFPPNSVLSKSTKSAYQTAYSNCSDLYDCVFADLIAPDLQKVIDGCKLKRSSVEAILILFKQMYKYAIFADIIQEQDNKSQYVHINIPDDQEHGTPFSDKEMDILWKNSKNPEVQLILIMIYSGWRIGELGSLEVDLENKFFMGGSKTKAGKNRIVPIHPIIYDMVKERISKNKKLLTIGTTGYRSTHFYPTLESLNIIGDPKHTPHDCRHTFSKLCEKYGVLENDRKRMLGHSFKEDVTNGVYGHRDVEDLRVEIEKIKVPFVTTCD